MPSERLQAGKLVAAALAGSWQASPLLSLSPNDLARIELQILKSGAGSLIWLRLPQTARTSEFGLRLRDAYHLHLLQAAIHEQSIGEAVAALTTVGVEPLMAKGWVVARLYPESGMRPYTDIDLFVRPEQHAAATLALAARPASTTPVDLHAGFADLDDRAPDELYGRSTAVNVAGVEVRILGWEDHLRFLCLHLLRHGARRPLWLCDIGVVLESLPPDFDWQYFLGGDPRRSRAVVCVLKLAHELLGARLEGAPADQMRLQLPSWLVSAVLRQWGEDYRSRLISQRMHDALRRPDWLLRGLRERWRNPIELTYELGLPYNEWPRTPIQTVWYAHQGARWAFRSLSGALLPRLPARVGTLTS